MNRALQLFQRHLVVALLCLAQPAAPQKNNGARPTILLEGKAAILRVDLAGGSFSDFHLVDDPLNPLTWDSARSGSDARPMGHFLCLDRWGQPSKTEQRNGMPFHGEASRVLWQVLTQSRDEGEAELAAVLPMAGLRVTRRIRLSQDSPLFTVTERVTNTNPLGRIYNIVQHPTIAPPFLDEHTLVDANAKRGFMQSAPLPDPERLAFNWPSAENNGKKVNIRQLAADASPSVTSYVIEDEYGWTTASSPSRGLLIGYIWPSADYPWFNAWRHSEEGRPAARGLEFGTTGLHQPFPILVEKGRIFGRSLFAYLDASETATRSYAAFLFRIPADYQGVAKITYANGVLQLHEHGRRENRTLTMKAGNLFSQ